MGINEMIDKMGTKLERAASSKMLSISGWCGGTGKGVQEKRRC
jgi:hypothetical protein